MATDREFEDGALARCKTEWPLLDDVEEVLFRADDGVIIGTRDIATRHFNGRWMRFYTDGRIEKGILWGGDVWEASQEIQGA